MTYRLSIVLRSGTALVLVTSLGAVGPAPFDPPKSLLPQMAEYSGDDDDDYGDDDDYSEPEHDDEDSVTEESTPANDSITDELTTRIRESSDFCSTLEPQYYIDCLGNQVEQLARLIPPVGDYEDMRRILRQTGERLDALAEANEDTSKPRIRPRESSSVERPKTASRPLKATSTSPAVAAAAVEIIEEAQTRLLRSAPSQASKAAHYQRMAEALDSNKILLRSL